MNAAGRLFTFFLLHASIQTALNVNGKAITATNRQAHSRVADMILKPEVGT